MRIGIDARALSHPQAGGFKTYVGGLTNALATQDEGNELVIFLDRPVAPGVLPDSDRVYQRVLKSSPGWFGPAVREQVALPIDCIRQSLDVMHFPCATGAAVLRGPLVVTIHDVIEFVEQVPGWTPDREVTRRRLMSMYIRWATARMARCADIIVAPSEHARGEIARELNVPLAKIRAIPNGVATHFQRCQDEAKLTGIRRKYNLPAHYVLTFASASRRKNTDGLLSIYARLPPETRRDYPLAIICTHGLLQADLDKKVRQLGLDNCTCFLPPVPDAELVLLYNGATAFVYPSLYEGFGLPVLEAMACGTPVIASCLTSIPEVAGAAAELVDPRDEDAFARALYKVVMSPEQQLCLAERGMRRSADFSWNRAAGMMLDVYRDAANRRSS